MHIQRKQLCQIGFVLFVCFVLRFYGPVNPMGSCRARSVYLRGVLKYECNWVNFQKCLTNNAKIFISIFQNTRHHVIHKVSVF